MIGRNKKKTFQIIQAEDQVRLQRSLLRDPYGLRDDIPSPTAGASFNGRT